MRDSQLDAAAYVNQRSFRFPPSLFPVVMNEPIISRGFKGRRAPVERAGRVPPGQYEERGFPVLSAGPTPHVQLSIWEFMVRGVDGAAAKWNWNEFQALPHETITKDIHCVTKWSKLDTTWEGISIDTVIEEAAKHGVATAPFIVAHSYGGYTTNMPLEDVIGGKAWVAFAYDGKPLDPEHGGPARLLVPHLYFWKSAKWVRGIQFTAHNEPGFWEVNGYHDRGDPWREQRYEGDP
jgi:DMSO/TMAO reductase YedYZ molybdopterin-dependent catalytic subunit